MRLPLIVVTLLSWALTALALALPALTPEHAARAEVDTLKPRASALWPRVATDKYTAMTAKLGTLREGVHLVRARLPRDKSQDRGMRPIYVTAYDAMNANNFLSLVVDVTKRSTSILGRTAWDAKAYPYDVVGDQYDPPNLVLHNAGQVEWNFQHAQDRNWEYTYVKQLRRDTTLAQISAKAQQIILPARRYHPYKWNCKTFTVALEKKLQ